MNYRNKDFIKNFVELRLDDVPLVGGKNASLGQMISQLSSQNIRVPHGFAITIDAYWYYLESNNLVEKLKEVMINLIDYNDSNQLERIGKTVRDIILSGIVPQDLIDQIAKAYEQLSKEYTENNIAVAVRSSATAEDLPHASFAGQQETYLYVSGLDQLIESYKKSLASLFTNRAIVYRIEQKFDHFSVALSVGVQKMIKSDQACAGVAFSLEPETGSPDIISIESSYGLGETVVKGSVTPDQFLVHKPTYRKNFRSIIKKQLGDKEIELVYNKTGKLENISVSDTRKKIFSLTDDEIIEIARNVLCIEDYYSGLKGSWSPMDIEWAKDGPEGQIYIVQARPETIHGQKVQHTKVKQTVDTFYTLQADKNQLQQALVTTGLSVGQKIVTGKVRVIFDVNNSEQLREGEILVTEMTDPDWVPVMKRAAGIITCRGGRTCHAAIVSRELGVTAIIGAQNIDKLLQDGDQVTLDCSSGSVGYIYKGIIPFTTQHREMALIKPDALASIDVLVNCADPDNVFMLQNLPVDGVGLARLEFIINNTIKIHPMALVHPEKIIDTQITKKINAITGAYQDKKEFFIDTLAQGVGMIAAALYPKPVTVRLSDFKTNEYRNLLGGIYFEPEEENPMIGFRGASRYYHERYKEAFALECAALKKVRDVMGLTNVQVMIPFVRTVDEIKKVIEQMKHNGLVSGQNGLQIFMMAEIPSNGLLIDEFCQHVDGFSIGSNDLTQLTLGVDRDSELLAAAFDERDPAVKKMFELIITGARRHNKYVGICGQAPSDYPELGEYLIALGINSVSLNADSVVSFFNYFKNKKYNKK